CHHCRLPGIAPALLLTVTQRTPSCSSCRADRTDSRVQCHHCRPPGIAPALLLTVTQRTLPAP
ncbi:hypothetical protein NDU88_000118, partial [Pleurodeles waltl]